MWSKKYIKEPQKIYQKLMSDLNKFTILLGFASTLGNMDNFNIMPTPNEIG